LPQGKNKRLHSITPCGKSDLFDASNAASQFPMSGSWQGSHSCRVTTARRGFMKYNTRNSLEYLLGPKTNGANPFAIFEAIPKADAGALCFAIKRMQ
jgi:hypothetical protein